MGRADIKGETGAGRYTIEIDGGTGIAEARIDYYNKIIAQQEGKIAELEPLLAYYQVQENIAESYLTGSINAYNETEQGESDKEQLKSAQSLLIKARENTREVRQRLGIANTTLANAVGKKASLTGISLVQSRSVWCADYTEGAEGDVATIEINAEPPVTLIAPSAPPATSEDGEMIDRRVQSGAQVYFNAALLPGWQKYQPTYRLGYITAIDRENDLCDVTLDQAKSSAQGLDINLADFLQGIPIEYMTCNAGIFDVGDDVVIKFDGGWENPKVIGFKDNPKPCAPAYLMFLVEENGNIVQTPAGEPDCHWVGVQSDIYTTNPSNQYATDRVITYGPRPEDEPWRTTCGPEDYGDFCNNERTQLTTRHTTLRIRFDVALAREAHENPQSLFQWEMGLETQEYGVMYDFTPTLGGELTVTPTRITYYNRTTGPPIDYGYYDFPYGFYDWHYIGPSGPTLAGTVTQYIMPGKYLNGQALHDASVYPDYWGKQGDDLSSCYSPPRSITVEILGRPVRYILDALCGEPPRGKFIDGTYYEVARTPENTITVPVADPPTVNKSQEYELYARARTQGGEKGWWIYYRREDVPTIDDDEWDFGKAAIYSNI